MKIAPERLAELSQERRAAIMHRSMEDITAIYDYIRGILQDVRARGDQAVMQELAELKPDLSAGDLVVSEDELAAAYDQVPAEVVEHLKIAATNIRTFHAAQLERPMWQMQVAPGIFAGRKHTPWTRPAATCRACGRFTPPPP